MNELHQIVAALENAPAGNAVLATLVGVEGSSYRRPGARLLLTPDGRRIGSISGGCLEDDVLAHAQQVRASGKPAVVTYDTTTENDLLWGVRLGCHGIVHVFLERLPARPAWVATLRENLRQRKPTELAVVWQSTDPALLGTWLAAELAAAPVLAIAGGQAPPSSAGFQPASMPGGPAGRPALPPTPPAASNIETLRNAGFQPASMPGGPAGRPALPPTPPAAPTTEIFRQTIPPPVSLVVFGAGDDVQPLAHFAKGLGWHVCVVDARPAFATPARFPEADAIAVVRPEDAVARIDLAADAVAIVMTHRYRDDVLLLRTLLPRPLAYLGLLGPKKRAERILADLAADGFQTSLEMRARLHAPVGLDLGAESPEEVALAMLAEVKAVLAGRDARPLRERVRPIHA